MNIDFDALREGEAYDLALRAINFLTLEETVSVVIDRVNWGDKEDFIEALKNKWEEAK